MKIDDKLSEVFDTQVIAKTSSEGEVVDAATGEIINTSDTKIENDYDDTRNNLRELLLTGKSALAHALEVAKQSEHPRAFEVVGNLMKQMADVNQQLMDIHQQKKKLDVTLKGENNKVTNNNAIFVGSTAELNKLINKMSKGD